MHRIVIIIVFLTGASFPSSGQDYQAAAKESCDCFQKSKDTIAVEFRLLLISVTHQTNIKAAFSKAIDSLPETQKRSFFEQLGTIGSALDSEDTEVGKCLLTIAEKYEYQKYKSDLQLAKEYTLKLSNEMKRIKDCALLAAMYLYAISMYE